MGDLYLFKNTLRDLMRPRKVAAVVLIVLLPALIALLQRTIGSHSDLTPALIYNFLADKVVFGFILVLLVVVFCSDVIAQEVEQKTIVYLLTRPVPRWRILLMKFAATIVAAVAAVWISAALLALVAYGPAGLTNSRFLRDLIISVVGVLAYGGLFLLLATLINRPMIYGLLFAFGWETWVPNLPGSFKMTSLMAYIRVLAPHPMPTETEVNPLQALMATDEITTKLAWTVLLCVLAVTLAASLFVFSTKEYVPREDAE